MGQPNADELTRFCQESAQEAVQSLGQDRSLPPRGTVRMTSGVRSLPGGGTEKPDEGPPYQAGRPPSGSGVRATNEGARQEDSHALGGPGAPQSQYWGGQNQAMDPRFPGGQYPPAQKPVQSWGGAPGPNWSWSAMGGWNRQEGNPPTGAQNTGEGGPRHAAGAWEDAGRGHPGGSWQGQNLPPGDQSRAARDTQEERRVPDMAPSWQEPARPSSRGEELGRSQRGGNNQAMAGHQQGGASAQGLELAARESLRRAQSAGAWFLPPIPEMGASEPHRENRGQFNQQQGAFPQREPWFQRPQAGASEGSQGAPWQQKVDHEGTWRAQPSFPGVYDPPASNARPASDRSRFPGFGGLPQFRAPGSGGFEQGPQGPPQIRPDAQRIVAETFELLKKDMMWPSQWDVYCQAATNLALASRYPANAGGFRGPGFPFGNFPGFGGQQTQAIRPPKQGRPSSSEHTAARGRPNTPLWGEDARGAVQQEETRGYGGSRPPSREQAQAWGEETNPTNPQRLAEGGHDTHRWNSGDRGWRGEENRASQEERLGHRKWTFGDRSSNRALASDGYEDVSEERNVLRMQGGSTEKGDQVSRKQKRGTGLDLNLDLNLGVSGSGEREPSGFRDSDDRKGGFRESDEREGEFRTPDENRTAQRDPDEAVREHLQAGKRHARLEEEARERGRSMEQEGQDGQGSQWTTPSGSERGGRDQSEARDSQPPPSCVGPNDPFPCQHSQQQFYQSEQEQRGPPPSAQGGGNANETNPLLGSFAPFAELMQYFGPQRFPPQNPNLPPPFFQNPGAGLRPPMPFNNPLNPASNPLNPSANPMDNWMRALAFQNPAALLAAYHIAGLGMQPPNPQNLQLPNPQNLQPPNPQNPPSGYQPFPPGQGLEKLVDASARSQSGGLEMKRPVEAVAHGDEKRQKMNHRGGDNQPGGGATGVGEADRPGTSDRALQRAWRSDPWAARGAEAAREGAGDAIEWDGTSTGTKRARNKGAVEPLFPHVSILPTPKPAFKKPPPLVLLRDGSTVELKKLSPAKRRELKKERDTHRTLAGGREEGGKGSGVSGASGRVAGTSGGQATALSEGGLSGDKSAERGSSRGLEVSQSPRSVSEEAGLKGGVSGVHGLDSKSISGSEEAPTVINEGSQLVNKEILPTVTTIGQSSRGDGSGSDSTVAGGRVLEAVGNLVPSAKSSGKTRDGEGRGGASCGTESGPPVGKKDRDHDEDDKGDHQGGPSGNAGQGVSLGGRVTAKGAVKNPDSGGGSRSGSGSGSERSRGNVLQHRVMSLKIQPRKGVTVKRKACGLGGQRLACKKVGQPPLRLAPLQKVHAWGVPWKKSESVPDVYKLSSWNKPSLGSPLKAR